ncbi:MAG: hypothetical protein ACLQM8_17740 [Limisphaerales bacterium]
MKSGLSFLGAAGTVPVSKVRSLRSGEVNFKAEDQGEFELAVPTREVTDVLVVE